MAVVYGALMVLALIGMIICSKKQKTNPAMQPVAFVLFIVVVIGAIMLLREMNVFGGNDSLLSNELKFYTSQGNEVGIFLAKENGGKKVLFVADPGFETSDNIKSLVDAFKKGYGSENVVVDTIALPDDQKDAPMPLYMIMKAKDFDALLEKHADCQVVVTSIGLPGDVNKMKFWRMAADKRPALFLLGLPSGRIDGLADQIKKGVVAGVVVSNPQAKYDVPAPSDPAEAFAIRYILVDKSNVDANAASLNN